MNVLEKILEEISEAEKEYVTGHKVLYALGATGMATEISGIIRSHMDDVPKCGECSRKKLYQIGYEDGKKDKDWISIKKVGLPKLEEISTTNFSSIYKSKEVLIQTKRGERFVAYCRKEVYENKKWNDEI